MAVRQAMQALCRELVQETQKKIIYTREILLALLVIGIGVGGYFGHRWYTSYREKNAQKALSALLEDRQRAFDGEPQDWQRVADSCATGYAQHSDSHIAPYFMAFQADALVQQGKHDEALVVLDSAIANMSSDEPLTSLFKVKQALALLDTDNDAQKGLGLLRELSDDASNHSRDVALYYLGLYHWSRDEIKDAHTRWQTLVDAQAAVHAPSPWANLAQEKLKQSTSLAA